MVGYNYRMPNLNAALLMAQLENLNYFLKNKRKLARKYEAFLKKKKYNFLKEPKNSKSNYWLNLIIFENKKQRERFLKETNSKGVMTRPIWIPMNKAYAKNGSVILAVGSHKLGYIPSNHIKGKKNRSEQHKISEKLIKNFKKKFVNANVGDLAFINFHLVHSSGKNVSQSIRYTTQIRFTRNDGDDYNPPNLSLNYNN